MEEKHREGMWEGAQSFPAPQVCCPPSTSTCSLEALQTPLLGFYGGFIMWARLINSLAIGDWTQLPAPPPPQLSRGGTASFNSSITGLVPMATSPHPPRVTSLTQTQVWLKGLAVKNRSCCKHFYQSGIPRVPGGLRQRPGTRPSINLLYHIRRSVPGTKTKHIFYYIWYHNGGTILAGNSGFSAPWPKLFLNIGNPMSDFDDHRAIILSFANIII